MREQPFLEGSGLSDGMKESKYSVPVKEQDDNMEEEMKTWNCLRC